MKIEAVFSKSNTGVARVDSAGYQHEGLEKPMAEAKHIPGAVAVFNIILPLEAGETVSIDLVTGKLAYSSEPLTFFSGMLLYETIWWELVVSVLYIEPLFWTWWEKAIDSQTDMSGLDLRCKEKYTL